MKITVFGLSHLGAVVAASCSRYFEVVALDTDPTVVEALLAGRAPFVEPGLADLITTNWAARRLTFTTNSILACLGTDVLWLTDEVTDYDGAAVLERLRAVLPNLSPGTLVLISSRLPAGTGEALWRQFPQFHFACVPMNLPPGDALDRFETAERVVVGVRSPAKEALLETLFAPFTQHVDFMPTASAEALMSTDSASEMRDDPYS